VYFLALHLTFLLNAERSVQKLLDNNVVPVAAVVIMACNRPDYLERTVESILKYGSRLNHSFSKGKNIYSSILLLIS
jgi:alpha-1,3-mannosyl-glycoprotein beta-1,2-N-acetylglucosaminyltransferase